MKKVFNILSILLFLIVVISIFPIKHTINFEQLSKSDKEYIVCNQEAVTDFSWIKVADKNGNCELVYVKLEGESPFEFAEFGLYPKNTYIFYGKASPIKHLGSDMYIDFTSTAWDIVYPIKRTTLVGAFLPKSYICIWDIYIESINSPIYLLLLCLICLCIIGWFLLLVYQIFHKTYKNT